MKVVILAGGWGSRLGEKTEIIPKPMLKIGKKPILWHIMKIYSHYGYNDFIICLGVKAEIVKDYFYHYDIRNNDFTINLSNGKISYLKNQYNVNWKVSLIDTGLNTLKGARIKRVEKYIDPDINMLTYGDGVADININELMDFHKSHGKILTITGVLPPGRFGEIVEYNGEVQSFKEKPQETDRMINGGFMVFNKELLDFLSIDEDCDFEKGPLEILAKKGEVMVYKHDGNWSCMDNEEDLKYLRNLWDEGKAFWKVWD